MASKAENNIVTLSINTTKNCEKFQLMQKIVRLQFFAIFSTSFQKIANLAIFAIFAIFCKHMKNRNFCSCEQTWT